MANPLVAGAVGSIGSSLIGARASRKAASAQERAAMMQADVQRENAERAAEAAKFRAVGFTSPYATPRFDVDDEGNLVSVDTQLSPELQARFDALQGAAGQMFDPALQRAVDMRRQGVADTLFGLGQEQLGAVQLDPTQAAAERTRRMQEILAPERAAQQEQLFSDLAAKGLTGLAVDQGTGQQVNPYMAALAGQQAQQDRRIAAESLDLADQQIANQLRRATGLFEGATQQEIRQGQQAELALQPYQSLFGAGQGIYNIGLAEQDRAMQLADVERQRRIAGATQQANFMGQAAQLSAQGAQDAALTRMGGQLGIARGFRDLDFGGFFNQQPQYSAATQRGLTIARNDPNAIGGTFGD